MGCFRFSCSAPVDHPNAGERAACVIGVTNYMGKGTVAERSPGQQLDNRTLKLGRRFRHASSKMVEVSLFPTDHRGETKSNDALEVLIGRFPDRATE